MSEERDLTRREVVQMAGVAGAAAVASQVVGAPAIQKVKAANDQVQFGVIGTGSRGTYLLRHLKGIDNGRCTALCDVWEPSLREAAKTIGTNPKTYKDYRELLSDKSVDAVIIATPLYMHFPCTKDALLAGKHVFCEKSLVFKPEEVHELKNLYAQYEKKQVLQVGLQRRYSEFYQAVKQMIDKGELGKVSHIRGQWHRNTFAKDPWNKPVPAGRTDKEQNWRKYREFSGGLTAELGSHQMDVADWFFGSGFDYVIGVGGRDFINDGRDIFDNIQLIFKYPKGQKFLYSSITTNGSLDLLRSERREFGEVIMGTEGTIHITLGGDDYPATALWFPEPPKPQVGGAKKEAVKAGATIATGAAQKGLPIFLDKDKITGQESFWEKEAKFARRWLAQKGIMMPEEPRNPVDTQLEAFFDACRTLKRPKADLEVGLTDSAGVILANTAMYEERRVYFNEIEKLGKTVPSPAVPNGKPAAAGAKRS
jgi:predicted dehydrogenase